MTWSNEYRESIREREIFNEISSVRTKGLKDINGVLLLIVFVAFSNLITAISVTERLGNIERKVEITHEIDKWWILEEIFGDKK
jgi:hypothetical protein